MNPTHTIGVCLLLVSQAVCAETHKNFDVVIAGGSTAAFAAAVSAAESGARVALLEPTDWIGGQLTSSGVPAVDEAWHKLTDDAGNITLNVAAIARTPANISPHLRRMLDATGCPGECWVSRYCFEPANLLREHLEPLEKEFGIVVFRETVIKDALVRDDQIIELHAIQRIPLNKESKSYAALPSAEIPDWYSANSSEKFRKIVHQFSGEDLVFVDATEWGELLVLADAPYLLGVETEDGKPEGDDSYGQSITFGFVQELHESPNSNRDKDVPSPDLGNLGLGDYAERKDAWDQVWTYRRLRATDREVRSGDLSLQNWGYYVERKEGGNDYPFGYLFLGYDEAERQANKNWMGGVDLKVMAAAEQRAYAWHHWFKSHAPDKIGADRVSLNRETLGAAHGLSKLPYIRDTRRSIGIDGFLLKVSDLEPQKTGSLAKTFDDRIALGAYPVDIHPMANRKYPDYIYREYDIAPFTVPTGH